MPIILFGEFLALNIRTERLLNVNYLSPGRLGTVKNPMSKELLRGCQNNATPCGLSVISKLAVRPSEREESVLTL